MKAQQLIDLSIAETRIVTEYPDTAAEQEALCTDLGVECEDSADVSGEGYSGAEGRGRVEYWGTDEDGSEWRVHVVRAT